MFLAFLGPPTYLRQHKQYCKSAEIAIFFDPTHPPLCWRNTWMVPNGKKFASINILAGNAAVLTETWQVFGKSK